MYAMMKIAKMFNNLYLNIENKLSWRDGIRSIAYYINTIRLGGGDQGLICVSLSLLAPGGDQTRWVGLLNRRYGTFGRQSIPKRNFSLTSRFDGCSNLLFVHLQANWSISCRNPLIWSARSMSSRSHWIRFLF